MGLFKSMKDMAEVTKSAKQLQAQSSARRVTSPGSEARWRRWAT